MEWGLGGGGWALMPPSRSGKFLIKIVDHYKCVRHGNVPFTKNVQSRLICPTGSGRDHSTRNFQYHPPCNQLLVRHVGKTRSLYPRHHDPRSSSNKWISAHTYFTTT